MDTTYYTTALSELIYNEATDTYEVGQATTTRQGVPLAGCYYIHIMGRATGKTARAL